MQTDDLLNKIHEYTLEDIMGDRFARYSKYIIQDRAIPDVRDGLKPVQRRIIYAMYRDKNTYNNKFKKCANAVGNTLGKYHPHGDTSVYDALIRMSQTWKQNHVLAEIHGNNGSIDGDLAAAMRYTETRLSKISEELLKDIDKNTVIMAPNYDDSLLEPTVLPARFPNLLVNGATGISAGYATNIPPHNLGEIIDATIKRIDSPNCRLETITDIVKGPDFPTGGIAQGKEGILNAFSTGKGKVIVECKYEIIKTKGKEQIIIHEIPFDVNKATLIKRIDDIRLDKKIDGIAEVRDESDKEANLRIAIDIKSGADSSLILNYLLKNTELQVAYNYNIVTIVNRRPKLLGIIPILDAYIEHQKEVTINRTKYDLAYDMSKMHTTEGIIKAISILDEVIACIRKSKNRQDSKENLMKEFDFTDKQAEAIITLQLYRLSNTDVTLLMEELERLRQNIERYNLILNDESVLMGVIKDELKAIKKEYAIPRRTQIIDEVVEIKIDAKEMIKKENTIVVLTKDGYIKRVSLKSYSSSKEEETGLKAGDYVLDAFETTTLDSIIIITSKGNYLYMPVNDINDSKWKDLGVHISNLATINPEEKVIASYILTETNGNKEIMLFSKNGQGMRTSLENFRVTRNSKTITAMKLKNDDELISAIEVDSNIVAVSNDGYYVMFASDEVPLVNVKASGVKIMSLKGNYVASVCNTNEDYLTIFTNKKTAKRIKAIDLVITGRAKRGSTILKKVKATNYEIMKVISSDAKKQIGLKIDSEIKYLKSSEVPIMDLQSTGSAYTKENVFDIFVSKDIEKTTCEPVKEELEVVTEELSEEIKTPKVKEQIKKETPKEINVKEMTIDDFINDFKL